MPLRDEIINWLDTAKADLEHAKKSMDIKDYSWACFAAQQAAEKALKSLIMYLFGEYPRGHDLVKLYERISSRVSLSVSKDSLLELSAYYTIARYPNAGIERPFEEIGEEQAKRAVEVSEVIVSEVSRIIRDP